MMTPPNFAWYSTCLFMVNIAHMTTLQESLHLESVHVGESMTLPCFCENDDTVMFYWYKQTVGHAPKLVSTFYKHSNEGSFHDEFNKNNSRFSLDTEHPRNLLISDLQISDSATYYCIGSDLEVFEFCNGTTVSVQGSGLNIPVLVHQSASESIQPGGSVTLNCTVHTGTCDGEHSVYWFKDSEESHPGLIYTHGGRNDQCERKPNTQTHTCVYNLPMKSLNLSHAGTYYCAVAACGHILFRDEEKLDSEHEVDNLVLVYILSGALTFTTILVASLALSVYKIKKRNSRHCTDSRCSAALTPNALHDQNPGDLQYAALREFKVKRSTRQQNTTSACVYSTVRQ